MVTRSAVDTNFMLEITHGLRTQKRGDRVSHYTNFMLKITHDLRTQKRGDGSAVDTNFMLKITHILSTQKHDDQVSRQRRFHTRNHSLPEHTETW